MQAQHKKVLSRKQRRQKCLLGQRQERLVRVFLLIHQPDPYPQPKHLMPVAHTPNQAALYKLAFRYGVRVEAVAVQSFRQMNAVAVVVVVMLRRGFLPQVLERLKL